MTRHGNWKKDKHGELRPVPRSLLKNTAQPNSHVTKMQEAADNAAQELDRIQAEARAKGFGTEGWKEEKMRLREAVMANKAIVENLKENPTPSKKQKTTKKGSLMGPDRKRTIERARQELSRARVQFNDHVDCERDIQHAKNMVKYAEENLDAAKKANLYKNLMHRYAEYKKQFPINTMKAMVQKAVELLAPKYAMMGCVILRTKPEDEEEEEEEGKDDAREADKEPEEEEVDPTLDDDDDELYVDEDSAEEEKDEADPALDDDGDDELGMDEDRADGERNAASKEDGVAKDNGEEDAVVELHDDIQKAKDFANMLNWLDTAAEHLEVHQFEVLELAKKDFMSHIHELPGWDVVGFNRGINASGHVIGYTVDWIPKCEWWSDPDWRHLKKFCTRPLEVLTVEDTDEDFAAELEAAPEETVVGEGVVTGAVPVDHRASVSDSDS